jgi:pyrophosphatase PpaX
MEKIRIKFIFFDLSGTLSNDLKKVLEVNNIVRKMFGLKKINLKEFKEIASSSFKQFFSELGIEDPESLYIKLYEKSLEKVSPIPGAKNTLKSTKEKGIKNIIITTHPPKLTLKDMYEEELFEHIDYYQPGVRDKYEAIMKMMEKLEAKPSEVLVVDDTIYGIKAGKKAGTYTAAVITRYSYHTKKRLESANPDFRLYRISDLLKILD